MSKGNGFIIFQNIPDNKCYYAGKSDGEDFYSDDINDAKVFRTWIAAAMIAYKSYKEVLESDDPDKEFADLILHKYVQIKPV